MIRAGIGGWAFAPWRGSFYPKGLPQAKELSFASGRLTAIEINATFYRTQTPQTFAKWAAETPDGFVCTVKAPRYVTNARQLAGTGDSIRRFLDSGLAELECRLGPILWQFPPTKRFDEADFAAFLALLPERLGNLRLRHALEVRHPSFEAEAFIAAARGANAAIVHADSDSYPRIEAETSDFAYLRLMRSRKEEPHGYPANELGQWVERAQEIERRGREVFVFFIDGYKPKAPAAATAFLERLGRG